MHAVFGIMNFCIYNAYFNNSLLMQHGNRFSNAKSSYAMMNIMNFYDRKVVKVEVGRQREDHLFLPQQEIQ